MDSQASVNWFWNYPTKGIFTDTHLWEYNEQTGTKDFNPTNWFVTETIEDQHTDWSFVVEVEDEGWPLMLQMNSIPIPVTAMVIIENEDWDFDDDGPLTLSSEGGAYVLTTY